jgi:hypothetical protein
MMQSGQDWCDDDGPRSVDGSLKRFSRRVRQFTSLDIHAPFFQSFVEVRVETSRKRVVLILNGIRGPLHWRDLQTGGTVLRLGATPHDPVEFVVPMDRE